MTVCSVTEHIDGSTPEGRWSRTIKLGVAEYDRDLDVVRATETSAALREQGRVFGNVPYGCVAVGGEILLTA